MPAAREDLVRRPARPAQIRRARPRFARRADRNRPGARRQVPARVHRAGRAHPARRCGGDVLHLGHHRQPEGRRPYPLHADQPRPRRRELRSADERRRGARLPAAGVDRAEHLFVFAVARLRLCRQLPRVVGDSDDRPEGDRAELLLRAAERFRRLADERDDSDGRRRRGQALAVPPLHGCRASHRSEAHGWRRARLGRAAALRARQHRHLRSAAQHARVVAGACGLHGGRGDRARPVHLLPRDRRQPEAALRLNRDRRVRLHAARQRSALRHGGHPLRRGRAAGGGQRRDPDPLAGSSEGLLQERRRHRRGAEPRRLVPHRRRGLRRRERASEDHRPRQGRRPAFGRPLRRRNVRAQVRREQAQVLPVHQGGGGLRRQARPGLRLHQHRLQRGRQLGREAQPAVCRLHRPGAKARGLCTDQGLHRKGQCRSRKRRQAVRQPGQPLPGAAQGARR